MNASEKVLMKLATKDKGAYLLIKTAGVAGLRKYAEEDTKTPAADAGGFGDSIVNWLKADDWAHAKQLGVGLGTAGLTYGLSALLPGAKQNRLLRLLSALAIGGTAGYYGDQIVNGTVDNFNNAVDWLKQKGDALFSGSSKSNGQTDTDKKKQNNPGSPSGKTDTAKQNNPPAPPQSELTEDEKEAISRIPTAPVNNSIHTDPINFV